MDGLLANQAIVLSFFYNCIQFIFLLKLYWEITWVISIQIIFQLLSIVINCNQKYDGSLSMKYKYMYVLFFYICNYFTTFSFTWYMFQPA